MSARRRSNRHEVDVRLLGPLEVLLDATPVPLGGAKPGALLAVLALDVGQAVSVDLLVEALWPGTPPETASHAVQVYVSQLRKALGAETIARRGPGYALDLVPERLDTRRFARSVAEGRELLAAGDPAAATTTLSEALALWRGPALQDFTYEPFAQAEIARLDDLRLDALEARIEADLALGRHHELLPELDALVQAQPLREHPRAQLMLALYRSGRQADALAAYRTARDTLVEELGIEPGHELRELEAAILRQDDSLLLLETAPARPPMQYRRLVTILFVDVVDSLALGEALDAEALASAQRQYFDAVSAAVTRHGGSIEKYAGDAVMAVFGVPVSHEDDALRAARAALDVRSGITALSDELERIHGLGLDVRIGLAAGEVVAASTESRQRFLAGDTVGVAALLQHAAEPGEIVVGEVVARLIDHAARLEPLGTLEMTSRKAPITMYRLVELEPSAPAFERRLDAPLVGRRRELSALRKASKRAVDDASAHVSVVVGPAGVGKSRLAAELARRAKGLTTLWGRCLPYGDGITFWPLREAAAQAPEGEERAAFLAALDAYTPPSAAEIGLAFRELCESLARERPLLVVLDDVHWAEPTLLEVIEGLADRGQGPIHVVCVAREELLEDEPGFLEGRETAERIVLDALSSEEAEALLDRLGAGMLESDQRDRIVASAEGNPLFLEQLLALALEGGLAERALPPTVQALLAARLDRLGPGERAVLERGAVVGKEFTADDVTALLEPEAVPTADAHLATLAARGFVRPRGDEAFAFRHGLVQEAAYRAAPKRLRAELHERYADRLDRSFPDLPDLDEFAGYHLEQAYRLRTELGDSDRRSEQLAEDAGRRLGDAGIRAEKRGDMSAAVSLLDRAASLLETNESRRCELRCELAIAQRATGDSESASRTLHSVIRESRDLGDRRLELRARIELVWARARAMGLVLDLAKEGTPIWEATGDHRSLGRAWLLVGAFHGARRGQHKAREDALERALVHYEKSGWPSSTCLGEIATALYQGPTPVREAIRRIEELRDHPATDLVGRTHLEVMLAGLVAQHGGFDEARGLAMAARATYADLGQRAARAIYATNVLGDIERLAGDLTAAEGVLCELCRELEEIGAYGVLASAAAEFASTLYALGRPDEAETWLLSAERHSSEDDLDARVLTMSMKAKLLARRGEFEEAGGLAGKAVELARSTDALNKRAGTHQALGEVLELAGQSAPAADQFREALRLYELKGNLAAAAQLRALRDVLALV